MQDERRVGICIKGGVSLGAYEAGVLSETLELIANNNSKANSIKWYVDTLAGASAGSMTSVATACTLLNSSSNYLREMWVENASLLALTPDPSGVSPEDGYQSGNNLLAASALDKLAQDFDVPPPTASESQRHGAHRPFPSGVRLVFTLSNINGIPNAVDTLNRTPLTFREYADLVTFDINIDNAGKVYMISPSTRAVAFNQGNDSASAWQAMVQAAIASGSFPLAFSPRGLYRLLAGGSTFTPEYYTDGGLFDNDPVGKLINLAHETDWAPENATYRDSQRRFVIVHTEAPDLSDQQISYSTFYKTLSINPVGLLEKVVPAFANESMQSGLRGITEVNRRFDQRKIVLNTFAKIAAVSPGGLPGTQQLEPAISALASLHKFSPDQINKLRGFIIEDLKDTDPPLYDYVTRLPDPGRGAFQDFALFFDLSFDVADKVSIKPIVIAPAQGASLAGDPLFGFAGFFSQRLREFDFAHGQHDAFQAWKEVSNGPDHDFTIEGAEEPTFSGNPEPDVDASTSTSEYGAALEVFRNRCRAVVGSAIKELKGEATPTTKLALSLVQVLANLGIGSIG